MKRPELKVRNEILKYILFHCPINCEWEWKGHIGKVFVEVKRIAENTIISCFCFDTLFIKLRASEGKVVEHKFEPVAEGLVQLRWFLEQIKKR